MQKGLDLPSPAGRSPALRAGAAATLGVFLMASSARENSSVSFIGSREPIKSELNQLYRAARTQWHDEEEIVLDATYQVLRDGTIDHAQAAQIAGELLGISVTATAWRLRVARWA